MKYTVKLEMEVTIHALDQAQAEEKSEQFYCMDVQDIINLELDESIISVIDVSRI